MWDIYVMCERMEAINQPKKGSQKERQRGKTMEMEMYVDEGA